MGVVQWLLLVLAVGAVVTIYVITKRREGVNPWSNMDDSESSAMTSAPAGRDSGHAGQGAGELDGRLTEVLGSDDIPDLPNDGNTPDAADDDFSDFRIKDEPEIPPETSQAPPSPEMPATSQDKPVDDINPAGLKRSGAISTADPADQRIIVLHVRSRDGQYFHGQEVHSALQSCKLQFGMQDVYHRLTEVNGVPESVFSVANMLKPGFLNPDEASALETPGLTLFMVLPGPTQGVPAFKDMLQTAKGLAQALGAEVLDDKRVPLTRQSAQYLLDEIAEDERRQRLKEKHG